MKTDHKSITFVVTEDKVDGGYVAHGHWPDGNRDIITEGDDREQLITNIRDAIDCSFDENEPRPKLIHLHYVRDEVIAT
jgi:predicted RNase H-like HicB family nuclease